MSFERHMATMKLELSDGIMKWILICLADCENQKTGHCFPSIDYLVKTSGVSRSTIHVKLKKLEDMKLIQRHANRGRSNHYSFLYDLKVIRKEPVRQLDTPVREMDTNLEVTKNKDVDKSQLVSVFDTWNPSEDQKQIIDNELPHLGGIDHNAEIKKYKRYWKDKGVVHSPFACYQSWCRRIQGVNIANKSREELSKCSISKTKTKSNRGKTSLASAFGLSLSD